MTPPPTRGSDLTDFSAGHVFTEVRGRVGFITLNRPSALNALSLPMIRALTASLMAWQTDERIGAVAFRGMGKAGPFGLFCAGGDIRFFFQAVLAGNAELEDFFTEEYALNHLIHTYPKPTLAFMDGIVMGGGMGIAQGTTHRLVTEKTRMAMPETGIGLFPDVGGGYFLGRCPGAVGEWLALTGETIGAGDAIVFGLADHCIALASQAVIWEALGAAQLDLPSALDDMIAPYLIASQAMITGAIADIDAIFSLNSVSAIVQALEGNGSSPWAAQTAARLRLNSPLMLHVTLAQIRRARSLGLADELRMERDMIRHCFNPLHLGRNPAASETTEGIRALAVDKDRTPKWNPASIEDVMADMVAPFFESPWPGFAHPLRGLA